VKSVSTLWAVAEPAVAATIERAHRAAVNDALRFIEQQALFTRTGPQGIRQVNVRGLVGAAFTHRDSRAGDPDLHTHVAVANKVQTLDGRWLSIDGRVLFIGQGCRVGDLQHRPGAAPPRHAGGPVRCAS
jgi:conjugative relaxase-like TrwC/TraI family protein